MQKTVRIFTGFRYKISGMTNADIAADGRQNPADGNRRVRMRSQQDMRHHGSGGRFSVCACNGDGLFVVVHDLA